MCVYIELLLRVHQACAQNGMALQFASDDLRANEEVIPRTKLPFCGLMGVHARVHVVPRTFPKKVLHNVCPPASDVQVGISPRRCARLSALILPCFSYVNDEIV